MLWLIGIVCLAAGLVAGLFVAKRISGSSPAKVAELEARVQDLQRHHAQYRDNVSDHFNTTAELVQHMTESYRDVYQHLAGGAQELCTDDVASKLLPASEQSVFYHADDSALEPPKDYAPKKAPGQSGALAENFGLDVDTDTSANVDLNKEPGKVQIKETETETETETDNDKDKDKDKYEEKAEKEMETGKEMEKETDMDQNQYQDADKDQYQDADQDKDKDKDISRDQSKDTKQAVNQD